MEIRKHHNSFLKYYRIGRLNQYDVPVLRDARSEVSLKVLNAPRGGELNPLVIKICKIVSLYYEVISVVTLY